MAQRKPKYTGKRKVAPNPAARMMSMEEAEVAHKGAAERMMAADVEFEPMHEFHEVKNGDVASNGATPELVGPVQPKEEPKESNSVVSAKFKNRYIIAAREAGIKGKAARRSNWDWLAQRIAELCLTPKQAFKVDEFLALLDANGIDHSRWTNRSRGWEGRLRMTGRVALQRIVADSGVLKLPSGDELKAPDEFRAKWKTRE
jgi:hypothetical protein